MTEPDPGQVERVLAKALGVPVSALGKAALEPIRVAVIDSGIDASHPALAGRVQQSMLVSAGGAGEITIAPTDPSANNDTYGHGTNVSSIIARIAPHTTLIDIRVLGSNNYGPEDALLAGIERANELGVDMMNISVAIGAPYLARLIPLTDIAYRQKRVIVAATRNLPLLDDGFPASVTTVIGVGLAGRGAEDQWRYQRDIIEFMTHGVDVPAAAPGGAYTRVTGTSFATPIMSGIVALILGAYPGIAPFEVKALLKGLAAEIRDPRRRSNRTS